VICLLAWTFAPQEWRKEPLITIANAELRKELQLPSSKEVFSSAELAGHAPLQALIDELAHVEGGRKLNPLESKVSDLHDKLLLLDAVFRGEMILLIPDPKDVGVAWQPPRSADRSDAPETKALGLAWADLRAAFLADDDAAFVKASEQLVDAAGSLPGARRPDPHLVAVELRYNQLRPFRIAWMVMVASTLLAAGGMLVRRKWFDVLAATAMLAGFALLSYGLWMRWQIAGRIPAANMFESLLFLSWGMGVFAVLAMLIQRQRIVPLTASFMGALALILADCLPLDHFIRPVAPVLLDTVWMSIHVPIIMVSYSVLALGVLIAHGQLLVMAAWPRRYDTIGAVDAMHYWYIHVGSVLLLIGIVTGSMWAASSWGRHWGWDPKEVWSLVAFLGYMIILHVRINRERVPRALYVFAAVLGIAIAVLALWPMGSLTAGRGATAVGVLLMLAFFVLARGQFATALKSILAFWLIVMTYVGVNFVLGSGLHSYGFGTGAVAHYMFLVGGLDLALAAVCSLVYLLRRSGRAPAVQHVVARVSPAT